MAALPSDGLAEDAWLQNFLPTPPRPLQQALQKRLHASNTHLQSLVELFKQRALIEAHYADSLAKLAKTAQQGSLLSKAGIEWERGSGEAKLFNALVEELSQESTAHSTLAAVLRTDYEQPLRELPNKIPAWRRIGEQDASLEKTLKDYEKVSTKLGKAATKTKSSKADSLSAELGQITSSLASLSPMVYTTYQKLDEERLRSLKEAIVRWSTLRADMSQRDGERAERNVATLISWETSEEVARIGVTLGSTGGQGAQTAPSVAALDSIRSQTRSLRRPSSVNSQTPQDFEPRTASSGESAFGSPSAAPPSSFAGGIKSILSRKPTIGPGRGRSNSGTNSMNSAQLRDRLPTPVERSDSSGTRQQDSAASQIDAEGFSVAPADRHRTPWTEPASIDLEDDVDRPATVFTQNFSASPNNSNDNVHATPADQPRLNLSLSSAPIQEAERDHLAALEKMQQTLAMQPAQAPSRRQTIARGRREVRSTVFAGSSGISGPAPVSPEELFAGRNGNAASHGDLSFDDEARSPPSSTLLISENPFDLPPPPTPAIPSTVRQSPGLHATMVETVNAVFLNGQVQKLQVHGTIHLSLRSPPHLSLNDQGPVHLRITDFECLEKIAPNPAYLAQVPDKPGEYFLNSEILTANDEGKSGDSTLLFRYNVHIPVGNELSLTPLVLDSAFRCAKGDTRMILNYRSSPTSAVPVSEVSNLTLTAAFRPGPEVSNVQAKPPGGVWTPTSRRMIWSEALSSEGKVIAKYNCDAEETLSPLGVQASWALEGHLLSGIEIEVVQGELETDWALTEVRKRVVTGRYIAEPVIN